MNNEPISEKILTLQRDNAREMLTARPRSAEKPSASGAQQRLGSPGLRLATGSMREFDLPPLVQPPVAEDTGWLKFSPVQILPVRNNLPTRFEVVVQDDHTAIGPPGTIVVPIPSSWAAATQAYVEIDLEVRVYAFKGVNEEEDDYNFEILNMEALETYAHEKGLVYPLLPETDAMSDAIANNKGVSANALKVAIADEPGRAVISVVVVVDCRDD